jgi:hypothetical protein
MKKSRNVVLMIDDNMCGEFLEFEHRDRMIKVMTNGRKTEALSCPERKIEMAGRFPAHLSPYNDTDRLRARFRASRNSVIFTS